MSQRITIDNVLEILKIADLFADLENLKIKAANFVFANHVKIFSKPDWTEYAVGNPTILNDLLKIFLNN